MRGWERVKAALPTVLQWRIFQVETLAARLAPFWR